MDDVILAFDAGTSGVKVSIVSKQGEIIDAVTAPYSTRYAPGGIAEQDPADWQKAITGAANALADKNPGLSDAVAAIGVSGHMLGCIPVNRGGEPLHPCMIHSDTRAAAQCAKIDEGVGEGEIYRMSGNLPDARSSLAKQLWVKEHLPDVYKVTAKFLQCKDFITSRLTGNINNTDYSDAAHGGLMDIVEKRYDQEVFRCLGLDVHKQPKLRGSCESAGKLTAEAAGQLGLKSGIPVIVGGGDGACGAAGAGNVKLGDAFLCLGSTAWIARVTESPVIDGEGRIFNIPNLDGKTNSVYGAMQSAGTSLNWVMGLLSIAGYDELNDLAASVEKGCEGLVYLPYLDGERSPVFDPKACGVFAGVSVSHTRAHFARAAFEGVAYALRQIADIMREYGSLDSLRLIGGGAKSRVFPQIIADVARLSLKSLNVPHENATALGTAAAAAVGAGMYKDMAQALSCITETEETAPCQQPVKEYEKVYASYQMLYPSLKNFMQINSRA